MSQLHWLHLGLVIASSRLSLRIHVAVVLLSRLNLGKLLLLGVHLIRVSLHQLLGLCISLHQVLGTSLHELLRLHLLLVDVGLCQLLHLRLGRLIVRLVHLLLQRVLLDARLVNLSKLRSGHCHCLIGWVGSCLGLCAIQEGAHS